MGRLVNDEPDSPTRPHTEGGSPDPILRAKYLDYCSAQLSEIFLSLSDERIYELVEEAAGEAKLDPGTLGFDAMVRLVTKKLRDSVPLPDFETWVADYRANPEHYDHLLLGLWQEGEERSDA